MKDYNLSEKILVDQPRYQLEQARKYIFSQLITDWQQATSFSLELREKLNDAVDLNIETELFTSKNSSSAKAKIKLSDGQAIETVLMRYSNRNTICLSCQVGCPMGCIFCMTGSMGFVRNLEEYEIIEQALFWQRWLNEQDQRIDNIVFMGMGEPMLNYENVMKAIRILNNQKLFNIGARHISISTSGIIEGIDQLAQEDIPVNLAISLHAPNDELRSQIMPVNKKNSLVKLLASVKKYFEKTGRKVMFEYLMIKDLNDDIKYAKQLVERLNGLKPGSYMINLIEYNKTFKYQASPKKQILLFSEYLQKNKIQTTIRYKFGRDIKGACGQLISKKI